MADKITIRVIQNGQERAYNYSALIGEFFDRIVKQHGHVEIADPELEEKLTSEELERLYVKFPHLNPSRELPPQPKAQKVEFRKEPTIEAATPEQEERLEEHIEYINEEVGRPHFEVMEVPALKEYLQEQGIEYNTRKKAKAYFLELALTTIK